MAVITIVPSSAHRTMARQGSAAHEGSGPVRLTP
jgi:hypothetical protein